VTEAMYFKRLDDYFQCQVLNSAYCSIDGGVNKKGVRRVGVDN